MHRHFSKDALIASTGDDCQALSHRLAEASNVVEMRV
jgi:hypothetical protein